MLSQRFPSFPFCSSSEIPFRFSSKIPSRHAKMLMIMLRTTAPKKVSPGSYALGQDCHRPATLMMMAYIIALDPQGMQQGLFPLHISEITLFSLNYGFFSILCYNNIKTQQTPSMEELIYE